MGPVVVLVINEALYTSFQFSWQIVVLKQDLVFQGTVPALDLTLDLRMIRASSRVLHILPRKILRQVRRDVGRAIVRQQPRACV